MEKNKLYVVTCEHCLADGTYFDVVSISKSKEKAVLALTNKKNEILKTESWQNYLKNNDVEIEDTEDSSFYKIPFDYEYFYLEIKEKTLDD